MGAIMVGVLGGTGPEATLHLMRHVIAAAPAEDDPDRAPVIVDQDPKAPPRIKALIEARAEGPAPTLAATPRPLIAAGPDAVAMPCDTARGHLGAIREAAGPVPALDMVALTAVSIAATAPKPARVGLLASTAMGITALYDRALAAYGIETAFPPGQDAVMDAIRAVKRGDLGGCPRAAMRSAAAEPTAAGADMLFVESTESSALAGAPAASARALEVFAEALVGSAAKRDTSGAGRSGPPGTLEESEAGSAHTRALDFRSSG